MGTLVGRAAELTALQRMVRRAAPGAAWAQVVGEPGIGKTRLLSELARWSESEGAAAFTGAGAEMESSFPYGVIIDALDDYLGSLDHSTLARLCGDHPEELMAVFPALATLGGPTAATGDARYRTFRAVRGLLERLAMSRPVLLIVDDLHWADPTTLQLMSFLCRRPPRGRVLMVMAWRSSHDRRINEELGEVGDTAGLRLMLKPLSQDEAAGLLGDVTDREVRAALYRDSGGNPFYLIELERHATGAFRTSKVPVAYHRSDALPDRVVGAVRAEVGALSALGRGVALGAAVAGISFDPSMAAACAQLSQGDALIGIDELAAAEVVFPDGNPRRFRFRHPIVHRAVYDSAPPGWRLAAHTRAATALTTRGAPPAVRAQHVAISAAPGEQHAIDVLVDAARTVKASAPHSAAHWLSVALDLLPSDGQTTRSRIEMLRDLAEVRGAFGDLVGAHAALEEALTLMPPGAPGRVSAVVATAAVEHGLGRFDLARARLVHAQDAAEAATLVERQSLELELAFADLFLLDFPGATRRARTVAENTPDSPVGAAALAFGCFVACCADDLASGADQHARAAFAVDRLTGAELAERPEAAFYLGSAEYLLGFYQDACRHLARVVTAAGNGNRQVIQAMKEQARALAVLGRLGEAVGLVEAAVDSARLANNTWLTAFALAAQAEILTAAGDLSAAQHAGEQAADLTPADAGYFRLGIDRQLAIIHLEAGRTARARTLLEATGAPDFPVVEPGTRCLIHETHARIELADGNLTAAQAAADRATAAAERTTLPVSLERAERAQAAVLLAADDADQAARRAAGAATSARSAGAVLEVARCLVLAGQAHAHAGRRDEAISDLTEAEAIFATAGALPQRDQAAQELRRLGVRQPGRRRRGQPGSGIKSLSGRERQVADLVAGSSNRQIADALYISEKTVEAHLARIFTKLGVTRRSSVAAAIEHQRGEDMPTPFDHQSR